MEITKKINFKATYYYSSLIFAFTLPLSRASISFFIFFIGIVWLLEKNYKDRFIAMWHNPMLKAIAIFLMFTLLSLLWTDQINNALKYLRMYSYWLIIFVLATSLDKKDIPNIITAFLSGMFISELIAYGIYFDLWSFKGASVTNLSPFMFWIDYSVFLAITAILILNRLFSSSYAIKEKLFLALFFISTTTNLLMGNGRTGQVALIVAIVVMVMLHFKVTIKSFVISTLLLLSIYGIALNLSDNFKSRVDVGLQDIKKMKNNDFDTSLGIRAAYWMVSYDIFKDHPLVGVGIGDYAQTMKAYLDKNDYPISKSTYKFMTNYHAHNQFLMIIIQTGLIGLILMFNILYQILKLPIKEVEIKNLSVLFTATYFVSCLAEPLWIKQFTLVLFILFLGMFIASSTSDNR